MLKERLTTEVKRRDTLLLSLSGAVIGILAAIAEQKLLSEHNIDLDSVVKMGGSAVFGASLAMGGVVKNISLRRKN